MVSYAAVGMAAGKAPVRGARVATPPPHQLRPNKSHSVRTTAYLHFLFSVSHTGDTRRYVWRMPPISGDLFVHLLTSMIVTAEH